MTELKTKTVSQKTRADFLVHILNELRWALNNNTKNASYLIGLIDGALKADERLTP